MHQILIYINKEQVHEAVVKKNICKSKQPRVAGIYVRDSLSPNRKVDAMMLAEVYGQFRNPGPEWRGKPFWSWNGELDKEELIRQSHIFKEMGFGGYFIHSRFGLITEYLGDEWFELVNSVADAGEEAGLEVWLYDEDRWPSGSAGGKVTQEPRYRMKSLMLFEADCDKFSWDDDVVFAFAAIIASDRLALLDYRIIQRNEDGAAVVESLSGNGDKKILYFRIVPDAPSSVYNGNTYLNAMDSAAVGRFIKLTHDAYQDKCGDRIGSSIKGIFTDEPHRGMTMDKTTAENGIRCCPLSYTDDLFKEFKDRYGYDVCLLLPELFYRYKGERLCKARIDYIDLCCNLFNERFIAAIDKWCAEHGILFTGHMLHEDSLTNQTVPNGSLMRSYMNMGAPGVDVLSEGNRGYWIVKQLASVARQFGKKWLLSELYGCTGWEFSFRSHKIVGDWQAFLGINMRCHHLSWYTMEGGCKRDYPASISYQSPYWQDYSFVESYFARFGAVMSQGVPVCDVLVLNPIESVWGMAHIGWADWIYPLEPDVYMLEEMYTQTFSELIQARVDFDYGEEWIMSLNWRIDKDGKDAILYIGQAGYHKIVVSGMLTMRSSTLNILKEFLIAGGQVIFSGDLPTYLDGVPSDACGALLEIGAQMIEFDKLGQELASADECPVKMDAGKNIFCQVRKNEDDFIVALLNVDSENPSGKFTITAVLPGYQVQLWNMETGERYAYPVDIDGSRLFVEVVLDAAASMILVFAKAKEDLPDWEVQHTKETGVLSEGEFDYVLTEPNVCVLDYARMKFDKDRTFGQLEEVLRIDNRLRDRLGIERRGGEMLQPWFAKRKYAESYGKLTLEYPFFIDVLPDSQVWLAGERPEVQEYYCNGVRLVNEDPHDWWVDNAFQKMPIPAGTLRLGENVITIVTEFKRTTNIEAIYLLGQFGVIAKAGASRLVAMPKSLTLSDLTKSNLPFYTGRATIAIPEEVYAPLIHKDAEHILVKVPHGTGTLISVQNGEKNIPIAWEPWLADVTDVVKKGAELRITLVNSRRNSFGPLHCVPTIQSAYGPFSFVTEGNEFSDEYALIPASIGEITFLCK